MILHESWQTISQNRCWIAQEHQVQGGWDTQKGQYKEQLQLHLR